MRGHKLRAPEGDLKSIEKNGPRDRIRTDRPNRGEKTTWDTKKQGNQRFW